MDIFLWEWTLPSYHILSRGIHSLISRKKGQPEEGVTVTSGWNLVARHTTKGARLWTQFVNRTSWIWGFWSFLYLWDSSMTRIRRTISTFTKTMKKAAEVFPNWSLWNGWSNKIGNSRQLLGQILHHLIGVSSHYLHCVLPMYRKIGLSSIEQLAPTWELGIEILPPRITGSVRSSTR